MIVKNVSGREIPVWTVGDPQSEPVVIPPGETATLGRKQLATVRAKRALQTGALVEQAGPGIVRRAVRSLLRRP